MMLSEHSNSIPISLLRQYSFCPRIPYFNETLDINPGDRKWQQQGIDFHQRQHMLNKRRNLSRYGVQQGEIRHNLALESTTLELHGICDAALVCAQEVIALEFKLSANAPQTGHKLQLAAYAMLLEEKFQRPAKRGFILYGERGKTLELPITSAIKMQVIKTRAAIQKMQANALIPHSSATEAQCGQCEYLNFCADRDC